MVKPQETPVGHRGKLMRLPFTIFRARRKSEGGFWRPSLGAFRKVLGQGNPAFGLGQSGSAMVAVIALALRVFALIFTVLSIRSLGREIGPYCHMTTLGPIYVTA